MASQVESYPATFNVEYPEKLNRLSTLFRIILSIPIVLLAAILIGPDSSTAVDEAGKQVSAGGADIMTSLFVVTALMIAVRQRYPRWWFDFALELNRFVARVGAYVFLMTDTYPSTVEKQSVQLDITYPDVKKDLNRWLSLVKWLFALPHYIVLVFLIIAALGATVIAWFAILFTGRYPRSLFDFVVGVGRWNLRVDAYAFLLTTDKYPPFSLK